MYELPQTLLHLTGPTLQGPFVGSKLGGTPNIGRQPVHIHSCLYLEHEVLVQLCSWESTIPFINCFLPRNLPLPDALSCHATLGDRPVASCSCTYTGAELCTLFQAVPRPPWPCTIHHFSLSPFSLLCTNSYWTDGQTSFLSCLLHILA
jgi:hypothetical protein